MFKYLGPGILLAGAAIGGSHLVASTQAGATYGWSLLGILFLVNVFKYPFFLFAQRYTAATGETILEGYLRRGKAFLIAFFALNLITGLTNIAGVSMITGSLAVNFGFQHIGVPTLSAAIMGICLLIIIFGGFSLLKNFGKIIVLVLGVSTLAAMTISLINGPVAPADYVGPSPWTNISFGFVILFMGWMPAPIDVSVWPSLWMKSQQAIQKNAFVMRETMIDFHTGYIASVVFAFVFLILGKMVMFGSGTELSDKGSLFARQLIDLYTSTIGLWARPVIIIAAFSAMFSTSLTTIDAYPRSLAVSCTLLFPSLSQQFKKLHIVWLITGTIFGYLLISYFVDQLGKMLALSMILSFLTAPVFAWINLLAMNNDNVPAQFRPRLWQKILSVMGIIFLSGFGLIFLYWYFFLQ